MKIVSLLALSATLVCTAVAYARPVPVHEVTINSREPTPVESGSRIISGSCGGKVAELILPLPGKHSRSVAIWRFAGVVHKTADIERLGSDLNRPELFYQYAMRCNPDGRGVAIYAMAVSFADAGSPKYFQARANVSNSGLVSEYYGIAQTSYDEMRTTVLPSRR